MVDIAGCGWQRSSVLKARDEVQEKEKNEPCYVAVKMIRNNETLFKTAKEMSYTEISAVTPMEGVIVSGC